MKDELGEGGAVISPGGPGSPSGVTLPSESIVENLEGQSQVDSYEDGDGGEIMVEVVGSDVFVDGVSGEIQGDVGPADVGVLEGPVSENVKKIETQNISEGANVLTEECGRKLEETEVVLSKKEEERNNTVVEDSEVNISESADGEIGAIPESSSVGVDNSDEVLNPTIEAAGVSSSAMVDDVAERSEEVMEKTSVVIVEEREILNESVDRGSVKCAAPEFLNPPAEVVILAEVDVTDKDKKLHLGDSAGSSGPIQILTSHVENDQSASSQVLSSEVSEEPNIECPNDDRVGNLDVEEEAATIDPGLAKPDDGSIAASVLGVSGIECSATDGSKGGVSEDKTDSTIGVCAMDVDPSHQEDFSVDNKVSDINEECLTSERADGVGMDTVELLDIKDGALDIDFPDVNLKKDECLKMSDHMESDIVQENKVSSTEPSKLADGVEYAEISKDEGLIIEKQVELHDNLPNVSGPGVGEVAEEVDSGLSPEVSLGGTANDPIIANSDLKVVDGDGNSDKNEIIDGKDSVVRLDSQGPLETPASDASTENITISMGDASSKVKTSDPGTGETAVPEMAETSDPEMAEAAYPEMAETADLTMGDNHVDPLHREDVAMENKVLDVHEECLTSERADAVGVDTVELLDIKDGPSDIDLPDASPKNDECLKMSDPMENAVLQENKVFSTEPSKLADGGEYAGISKDEGLRIDKQVELHDNLPNLSGPGLGEFAEVDSGLSAEDSLRGIVNDPIIANSDLKVVDGDGTSDKNEIIDEKVSVVHLDSQGPFETPASDASTENATVSTGNASSKVEAADPGPGETADPGTAGTTDPGTGEKADPLMAETADLTMADNHVESDNPFEDSGSLLSKEQNLSLELSEESNHRVSDLPMPSESADNSREVGDDSNRGNANQSHASEIELTDAEEKELSQAHNLSEEIDRRQVEAESEEFASETDKLKLLNEESVKSASESLRLDQPNYLSPPQNEGQFAVSDLVWGKVRSHPWWPGQIFDPADASEKAVKYQKKDSYLVAYFGDRTFAWNDASVLKPFRPHFSQIEKQSNSESFQNAVSSSLEEVSRRVELGLACSCISEDAFAELEVQVMENTGIRDELSRRCVVDPSCGVASFEPDKFLRYVCNLAPHASSGVDRLDLVIARAQLTAFCRFKGYRLPTEFPNAGELLEQDADTEKTSDGSIASYKRKHAPKDSLQSRKERSLNELLGDKEHPSDAEDLNGSVTSPSGKKRKAQDFVTEGSDKKQSIYAAKVSTTVNQTPKPSFKIGECIRRVASQLTGATSAVKVNHDDSGVNSSPKMHKQPAAKSMIVSSESSSLNEMLSQLELVAREPKKEHNFADTVNFFSGFRSSVAVNRRRRKKKADKSLVGGVTEEFEFDDVNDSYWTDRIVQNYSEEQLLHKNCEDGVGNLQLVPLEAEKSAKSGRRSNSRKRYSTGNYPTEDIESENVKRRKQESSPAELILNFAERNSIPLEISLNKTFRRFGPLMESETEVDHDLCRARVIFKRGSDAEVAHSSAEKFNIFGPVLVNYQIGYSPLISVKILPVELPQVVMEDAEVML